MSSIMNLLLVGNVKPPHMIEQLNQHFVSSLIYLCKLYVTKFHQYYEFTCTNVRSISYTFLNETC